MLNLIGQPLNLTFNQPISQSVNSSTRTIVNRTLPGHIFYPGTVTIQVNPLGPETSTLSIIGEGVGNEPEFNNFIGEAFFGPKAADAQNTCGR
jgi:hypothetical protein